MGLVLVGPGFGWVGARHSWQSGQHVEKLTLAMLSHAVQRRAYNNEWRAIVCRQRKENTRKQMPEADQSTNKKTIQKTMKRSRKQEYQRKNLPNSAAQK